jgi:hypothetical protein
MNIGDIRRLKRLPHGVDVNHHIIAILPPSGAMSL